MKLFRIISFVGFSCLLGILLLDAQGVVSRPSKASVPERSQKTPHQKTNSKSIPSIIPRDVITQQKQNKPLSGNVNGHEWVDLGLPSGVKWATCNIGSILPEDNGNYYTWGQLMTKNDFSEKNCITINKDVSWLKSIGIIDNNGNLTYDYDAATINWGSKWRIPTKEELEELQTYCVWVKTYLVGQSVFLVQGPNGQKIYIPDAGLKVTPKSYVGDKSILWSSSVVYNSYSAYGMIIPRKGSNVSIAPVSRDYECSIRPVIE